MKFSFVERVDTPLFEATRGAWAHQIESNSDNVSESYYAAALDFCGRVIADCDKDPRSGCVSAVQEDGCPYAAALIIVTHAKHKSEVRMLDVYVQPDLNLADSGPNYAALAWIAATAVVGCLELTYETYPADQLKLHTAFPLDREFMASLTTAIFGVEELQDHYQVSNAGNWLVVAKTQRDPPRLRLAD